MEQFTSSISQKKTSDGLYEILKYRAEPLRGYIAQELYMRDRYDNLQFLYALIFLLQDIVCKPCVSPCCFIIQQNQRFLPIDQMFVFMFYVREETKVFILNDLKRNVSTMNSQTIQREHQ